MLRRGIVLALLAAVVACAPARAATTGLRTYEVTRAIGAVTIAYHGSQKAGCASRGVCGVRGTMTFSLRGAGPRGTLMLLTSGSVLGGGGALLLKATTTATVRTAGSGTCRDSISPFSTTLSIGRGTGGLVVGIAGAQLPTPGIVKSKSTTIWVGSTNSGSGTTGQGPANAFDVSCSKPPMTAIAGALPLARVPRSTFLAPTFRLSFVGGSFGGGGFEGRVTSDVRLTVRRRACGAKQIDQCRRVDAVLRR